MDRTSAFRNFCHGIKTWFTVTVVIAIYFANPGFASCAPYPYAVTNLGVLGENNRASSINDAGQVSGYVFTSTEPVVNEATYWDKHLGTRTLQSLGGTSRIMEMNSTGQMVGESNNHAASWDNYLAAPKDMGTLGGATSFAMSIDNNGRIVGYSDMPEYYGYTVYHAFVYENNTMTDLGTLVDMGGSYYNGFSFAYDINNNGKIVGVASAGSNWDYHAFVWDKDHGMIDLGTHPEFPGYEGYASAINDTGDFIAGVAIDGNSNSYPLIWKNGVTTAQVVEPHPLFPYAEFNAMNNNNRVVGLMWDAAGVEHAIVYDEVTGIVDLNDLIDPSSGWLLTMASAINDNGDIVGWGFFQGTKRAFLLTAPATIPTVPLTITIPSLGTGNGTVSSSSTVSGIPNDISCTDTTCSAEYPYGSSVSLIATPGVTSVFAGWGNDCTTNPCNIIMDSDKFFTAKFNQASVAKNITTGTLYTSFTNALSLANSDDEIRLLDARIDGAVTLYKSIMLRGGWYTNYEAKSGILTQLKGNLTIQSGNSLVEDLLVNGKLIIQGGSVWVNSVTVAPVL